MVRKVDGWFIEDYDGNFPPVASDKTFQQAESWVERRQDGDLAVTRNTGDGDVTIFVPITVVRALLDMPQERVR